MLRLQCKADTNQASKMVRTSSIPALVKSKSKEKKQLLNFGTVHKVTRRQETLESYGYRFPDFGFSDFLNVSELDETQANWNTMSQSILQKDN